MYKFISVLGLVLFLSFSFAGWQGCSSSKPPVNSGSEESKDSDYDEIEKLLGITKEDKQQVEEEQKGDELLTLLEAGEEKGGNAGAETGDKRLIQLQKQVEQLKKQLREKNIQIADLKAQLRIKEEALKRYQSGGGSPVTESSSVSTPVVSSMPTSGSLDDQAYQARYEQALSLFNERRYREAIEIFQQLINQNDRHPLADNAQYWIGECYYMLGDYQAAVLAFEKVFTFPQSNKNDYAQYKLGLSYYRMGKRERAREEFQRLLDNYPDSPLVEKARDYLAQLGA
ncbi:MAG: tetratricopeptide repeat protein [Calditrichaeota bacterium]|nr:MAG: tetratricopeptide repeat protein [Calditrichota bacterium]